MIQLTGLLVLVVIVLLHLYIRYSYWGRHIAKIPGHADWPIFGDFYRVLNFSPESSFGYVRESKAKFGRIFKNRIFFVAAVNIHHPDDIEELYSSTVYNEKRVPYNFLRPWLYEGLLISNGEKWKQRRKLLTPSFHFNILKKFQVIFNEQTEHFLKRIKTEIDKEKTEVLPIITRATLNIMCETSMGISVQDGLEAVSTKYFHALRKLGHDTTAAALQFMIMRIANEPEVQENIYHELQQIFGTSIREPTTNDLNEMKYLECCIKESLRLYPSVPFMARYLVEDAQLGGYLVPAGTIIHTHVFDLHRNPEIYPDPEKFEPDRFLKENIAARHPYAYIPFSAGPRNCIGQKFAMLELKTVMSGLLRRFRLEPVTKPRDLVFVTDFILKARDPVYVRFRPRFKEN